jgi:demethylmenaquinone methyltransferase / 2-methoxy-6-polyprenyl-1,4-benzoquinol methylase
MVFSASLLHSCNSRRQGPGKRPPYATPVGHHLTAPNASTPTDATRRAGYDREAAQYDARRYDSAEGRYFSQLEVSILRSWVSPERGARLLDVPAGTGRLSHALARDGVTVVGADISANMLQVASSKEDPASTGSVHFILASGAQLPCADDTFDAVVSFKFFHLIPNERKRAFIREMTRVLKPGKPLIVEFNSPFYGGILAALRYYLRKKRPGGMRMKCLFPDQVEELFDGLEITRKIGVKLPMSAVLNSVLGQRRTDGLNLWIGGLPGVRYLTYAIIIEARKPLRNA